MRDFRDAKVMAQTLREALTAKNVTITHSECLELVAKEFGLADWNTLSAKIDTGQASVASPVSHNSTRRSLAPKKLIRGTRLPMVPVRDIVLFPQSVSSLVMGREKSFRAVEHAIAHDGRLLAVTQRNPDDENPAAAELYTMGVVATVLQCTKAPNGNMLLSWVQGEQRATVLRLTSNVVFSEVEIAPVAKDHTDSARARVLSRAVHEQFLSYAGEGQRRLLAARRPLPNSDDPGVLADAVASFLPIGITERQDLLETISVAARLEKIRAILIRDKAAA
jgi:uncharacterized protein